MKAALTKVNVMEQRYIAITEKISIPVPRSCTPKEEEAMIAKFKMEHDLNQLEEEYQQLEKAMRSGASTPMEEFLQKLGIMPADSSKETP